MRRIRDFLCGLAFLFFTTVSVWAAVLVTQDFTEIANRQPLDVRYWLTERDLAQEGPAVRSRVVRRIEEQLRSGNLAGEFRSLNEQQRARLTENLDLVMEQWYRGKVSEYMRQKPNRRDAWLDEQIQQLESAFQRNGDGLELPTGMPSSLPMIAMVLGKLETWTQRADPEMQAQMREFQQAVQQHVLTRRARPRPDRPRDNPR